MLGPQTKKENSSPASLRSLGEIFLTYTHCYIHLFILKFYLIYFWQYWVFVAACRLSLVAASRGCSLTVVRRLLTVVVSLVGEQRLSVLGLSSCGAWAELPCSTWIEGPGIEPGSPELAGAFLSTAPPGKSNGGNFEMKSRFCNIIALMVEVFWRRMFGLS